MTELKKAIDQISKDRGIDRDLLVDTLEEALDGEGKTDKVTTEDAE